MPYASLQNVTTTDDYADAATLHLQGAARLLLQVANAGVLYQLDESEQGDGAWTPERFLQPLVASMDRRCSGVRFRSAVAGAPAQVSAELLDELELANGADAVSPQSYTIDPSGGVSPTSGGHVPTVGDYKLSAQAADHADPSGGTWFVCDGRAIPAGHAALVSLLGANLPDGRGRVGVGLGTDGSVNAIGDSDGLAVAARKPLNTPSVTTTPVGPGATGVVDSVGQVGPAFVALGSWFVYSPGS